MIINGIKKDFVLVLIWLNLLIIALIEIRNPVKAFSSLKMLEKMRRIFMGNFFIQKIIYNRRRFFWDMYSAGWPSAGFNNYHAAELKYLAGMTNGETELKIILFGITNKCPLKCEHCFDWNSRGFPEKLSLNNLKSIIKTFQDNKISQIQLGGGEPLVRVNDLIEIVKSAKKITDFWVVTSGFNLTIQNAKRLKDAGVTGVSLSLDHHLAGEHNNFRGFRDSYAWVTEAAANCKKTGLLLALSLCATKEYVSEDNINSYLSLAVSLGASFVQILEPRPAGRWHGKNVYLDDHQYELLEEKFLKFNSSREFSHYPIIIYHVYHQKNVGCYGAGSRYLYVDSKGDIHNCPFCQNIIGNVLDDNLRTNILTLKTAGCNKYEMADVV